MKKKHIFDIVISLIFLMLIMFFGILSCKNLKAFYLGEAVFNNDTSINIGSKLENDIATTFFGKYCFVDFNGLIRNLLGQREMNGIAKLKNGYLFMPEPCSSNDYLQNCADRVIPFKKYLEDRGAVLVYAATPATPDKYDPQLPIGIEDHSNDNIDRFLKMLADRGIDTIDFRESMHNDGVDHYEMMYKTDHHWTTKAGFYGYTVIEEYLKNKIGCSIDDRVSNINNYTVTTYDEWHLGSRGQRTGKHFGGIDDFDVIIPNFDTNIINVDMGNTGTVAEMININQQSKRDLRKSAYDTIYGGTVGDFINIDAKNDVKILFITDSFGRVLSPYLTEGVREVKYVYDGDVSAVTPELIEEYNPDVVIMMYYYRMLNEAVEFRPFNFNGFE